MDHELKTLPEYFQFVWDGIKRFELRRDDRGFTKGDVLVLREWAGEYTGRRLRATVAHVMRDPAGSWLKPGVVALCLGDVSHDFDDPGDKRRFEAKAKRAKLMRELADAGDRRDSAACDAIEAELDALDDLPEPVDLGPPRIAPKPRPVRCAFTGCDEDAEPGELLCEEHKVVGQTCGACGHFEGAPDCAMGRCKKFTSTPSPDHPAPRACFRHKTDPDFWPF